ncbi:nucleic acid-binding protein [Niveomyces insectorum RCEF 264]|uniref:Nucleic acid-binding protein n=1 Tax=Niveomyces insectorum RCEF 264 TaxID=1081102 RepID=A0A167TUZ3_9HYPO|nr:nucleic acid-binding protein [Niveomyces insectorum RCEF 264]
MQRHSVRRVVLRSAASASVCAAASAKSASAATPLIRSVAAARAAYRPATVASLHAARFFSQTVRVAAAEDTKEAATEAAEGAEKPTEDAAETTQPSETSEMPKIENRETPYGVYINNLIFDATEESLGEAFGHYGPLTKVAIARDARGLNRGYAFVWYENEADMETAINEANGSFWHGRRLNVAKRTPGKDRLGRDTADRKRPSAEPRAPTESLYIGNLPYETTDADLNHLFRNLEGVRSVRVAVDRVTGWPRGFAHTDFHTVEQATAALNYLSGLTVGTRQVRVDYASPSAERRKGTSGQRKQDDSEGSSSSD